MTRRKLWPQIHSDIASFFHSRAVEFERLSKARTYLIVDEISLKQGTFTILGYFSIALKTLSIPETLILMAYSSLKCSVLY